MGNWILTSIKNDNFYYQNIFVFIHFHKPQLLVIIFWWNHFLVSYYYAIILIFCLKVRSSDFVWTFKFCKSPLFSLEIDITINVILNISNTSIYNVSHYYFCALQHILQYYALLHCYIYMLNVLYSLSPPHFQYYIMNNV